MSFTNLGANLEELKSLVIHAAHEELLTEFGHSSYEYKDDGSVVTPADLAMQHRLEKRIKTALANVRNTW